MVQVIIQEARTVAHHRYGYLPFSKGDDEQQSLRHDQKYCHLVKVQQRYIQHHNNKHE